MNQELQGCKILTPKVERTHNFSSGLNLEDQGSLKVRGSKINFVTTPSDKNCIPFNFRYF